VDDELPTQVFFNEQFRVQLLQLATLLIRCLPDDLVKHRKELIKFGWNHLKREDRASKQFAFVNVCYFLEAYQAPEKIILQVFVALLRACQPDAKELVKIALDALVPALPKRLPRGDHKYPIWIRYAKKILVEEGHSVPHLIHVWNLIVDHESHFYESRAQFVPQMVNSLSRLGLPSSAPIENRIVSINLVELILNWEDRRKDPAEFLASKKAAQDKMQEEETRKEDEDMKDASDGEDDENDKSASKKRKVVKLPPRRRKNQHAVVLVVRKLKPSTTRKERRKRKKRKRRKRRRENLPEAVSAEARRRTTRKRKIRQKRRLP